MKDALSTISEIKKSSLRYDGDPEKKKLKVQYSESAHVCQKQDIMKEDPNISPLHLIKFSKNI